jgi:hypothetical protein
MSTDSPTGATPDEIIAQYKSSKRKKRIKVALGIILGLIILTAIGSTQGNNQSSSPTSSNASTQTVDSSWVPSGFTQWVDDENLAWRWEKSSAGCA